MKPLRNEIDAIDRWLHRHKSRRPAAIVLGASVDGLAMVRSLGRRGIPVLLLHRERQFGAWTRFARVVAVDDTQRDGEMVLEFLADLGERLSAPAVIFPTSDHDSRFVADHQDELERHYKFLQPRAETLHGILDKSKQHRMAQTAGVPVVCDETLTAGDDEIYGYFGFWDEEAMERACLTTRLLRLNSRGINGGSLKQTVAAADVAKLSRTLLRAIEYRGLVTIDFKRDPRDGALQLMQITPRVEGGNQLAVSAGVDFAWIAYQHLTVGPAVGERATFTPGVTYMNEEADLDAFRERHKSGGVGTSEWLRAWFSARAYALAAWDDPMPFIALISSRARLGLHPNRLRLFSAAATSAQPLEQREERARARAMPKRDHADVR